MDLKKLSFIFINFRANDQIKTQYGSLKNNWECLKFGGKIYFNF